MTATRSPIVIASDWSWVTKTAGVPSDLKTRTSVGGGSGRAGWGRGWRTARRGASASVSAPVPGRAPPAASLHRTARVGIGDGGRTARPAQDVIDAPVGVGCLADAERHVVAHGEVREEGVLLEDEADVSSLRWDVTGSVVDAPTQLDRATVGGEQTPTRRSSVDLPHPLGPTRASSSAGSEWRLRRRRRRACRRSAW